MMLGLLFIRRSYGRQVCDGSSLALAAMAVAEKRAIVIFNDSEGADII